MFSDPLTPVADPSLYPWRVNAKAVIRFEKQDGSDSWDSCSATLIDGEVALLAGHCIYSLNNGYAKEIFIIPGWDGVGVTTPPSATLEPYGWMRGDFFLVGSDWVNEGNTDFDMGAVVLTRAAGMLTGWHGRSWGGTCQDSLGRTYTNVSYPKAGPTCSELSVELGLIMHEWGVTLDSCVGNLLQLDFTEPGCFTETHNGMSGSSAVFQVGQDDFAHATNSHKSDGNWARFCKMWQGFNIALTLYISQVARGTVLDIQPLACDGSKTMIFPGGSLDMTHLSVNPSNFDPPSQTYTFTWYLSDNDSITAADTPLTTRNVVWYHDAMGAATFSSLAVQIPQNTPAGTYWLGVIYDAGTDGSPENNISTYWDAYKLTVGGIGF